MKSLHWSVILLALLLAAVVPMVSAAPVQSSEKAQYVSVSPANTNYGRYETTSYAKYP
nr:hypothetical protein [uncultured Methanoregula sp.]